MCYNQQPLATRHCLVRYINKSAIMFSMREKKIAIDMPLSEITLRKYEKPYNLKQRELVRKLCLSTGLLQPGDSRDIVVDVLYVLLQAKKDNRELGSEEIRERVIRTREELNLALAGIASSNIRRQLKRLKDSLLVEKRLNAYRITEHSSLNEIFEERIEKFLLPSINSRIKEYLKRIDEL